MILRVQAIFEFESGRLGFRTRAFALSEVENDISQHFECTSIRVFLVAVETAFLPAQGGGNLPKDDVLAVYFPGNISVTPAELICRLPNQQLVSN